MRILHCCLACFYNEDYNYQENLLPRQNKQDGHEVWILASTEVFQNNKEIGYIEPQTYTNKEGIKVVRVPYRRIFNDQISHKIRSYKGVYSILEEFEPDVILFHGMGAWELKNIVKYVKKNNVKLYIDNHSSLLNSGKSRLSREILHGIFYKNILKRALPVTEKILCIAMDEYDMAKTVYRVPEDKLELWPLGGTIYSDNEYDRRRHVCRKQLGISEDKIIFLHSGKMDKLKKTCELLSAFHEVSDGKFILLIVGELLQNIEAEAKKLIEADRRICYLGWKSGSELYDLLMAADIYIQPGNMSATMQNAMCCRCAVVVQPTEIYKYFLGEDGIYVKTQEDIRRVLEDLSKNPERINEVRKKHFKRACEVLDYKQIAVRLYEGR